MTQPVEYAIAITLRTPGGDHITTHATITPAPGTTRRSLMNDFKRHAEQHNRVEHCAIVWFDLQPNQLPR
ncbi:hypothetical protein ACN20G_36875 (plasmid) [Streptomyces sp. BI20]|uniref:hypothetical protein n=1 Tax=Streptomyces sp. BI20 TaxID=3403460 RepID=UPI003C78FFA4